MTNPTFADKATWKVVSPPPDLPLESANALLAPWRGGHSVVEAKALSGGIMNWNYRIRLAGTAERFVLRFHDRMPAACAKEMRVLELVRGDVPVPSVLFAETDGALGYPPFCVLEFIDGISLRELRRRGNARGVAEAAYDAGRLLPRVARHRFERSGLLSPELQVHEGPFRDAPLTAVVDHFVASPLFRERVDASLRRRLNEFLRATEPLHLVPDDPVSLVHGDFNSPNIFVREDGARWVVASILDWDFAFAASMLCDVGNMLRYERPGQSRYEPHFSRGLEAGGWSQPDHWFLRARLADLPALCELLTRDDVPDAIVGELRELVSETLDSVP